MIGIEKPMPSNCNKCDLTMWTHIGIYCILSGEYRPEGMAERPHDCPLVDLSKWEDDGK